MYLNPVPNSRAPPIEHSIHQVVREASLLYCLPDNPFVRLWSEIKGQILIYDLQFSVADEDEAPHAVQEATYAYVGWIFAQHFCNRLGSAYIALKNGELGSLAFGSS
jgi:glutamate dehydrogenase